MRATAFIIALIPFLNGVKAIAQEHVAAPQVIIYKTNGDHRNFVPVTLSDDGSAIVSYPAVEDIRGHENDLRPSKLVKGYLLDNGGRINKHTAFLKLTYEQYSKLAEVPTLKELYVMVDDKAPIIAIYDCGMKGGTTSAKKLKALIRKNKLSTSCKKMN